MIKLGNPKNTSTYKWRIYFKSSGSLLKCRENKGLIGSMNQLVISSLILEAEARIGFQFQSFKVSMERLVKNSADKKILFICTLVRHFQMLWIRKTNFGVDMAINRFGHMGVTWRQYTFYHNSLAKFVMI